jgi:hypothetical protein
MKKKQSSRDIIKICVVVMLVQRHQQNRVLSQVLSPYQPDLKK